MSGAGSLPGVVSTVEGRLAVTAAVALALLAAGWAARRARRLGRKRRNSRVVDVVVGAALLVVVTAGVGALVAVWDAGGLVQSATANVGATVEVATQLLLTLALLAAVYVGTEFIHSVVHRVGDGQAQITQHQAEVVYRVLQVTSYVLAGVVVLGLWDVNLGGLLVGAGFLGIVVGMAARQTLGALLAGFVLMFARPFEIGDWVQIGDKEGIVTDITVVNTRIQTFDGEYVMLPNDTVSSSDIVNRTRKGRLRIEVGVGVDYDTDLDEAVDVAKSAMRDPDEVLTVPNPQVVVEGFGPSSVDLLLRFWIDKPTARRKWRAQSAVVRAVKADFEEHGIKIPFPQREVGGRTEEGGFRVTGDVPSAAVRGDDDD